MYFKKYDILINVNSCAGYFMDIGNYFNSRLFLNEYCASNEIFTGNEFDSKTVESIDYWSTVIKIMKRITYIGIIQ